MKSKIKIPTVEELVANNYRNIAEEHLKVFKKKHPNLSEEQYRNAKKQIENNLKKGILKYRIEV